MRGTRPPSGPPLDELEPPLDEVLPELLLDPPLEEPEAPLLEELEPPLEELDPLLDELEPPLELPPELDELPPSAGRVKVCPPHAPRATMETKNPSWRRMGRPPDPSSSSATGVPVGFLRPFAKMGRAMLCRSPVRPVALAPVLLSQAGAGRPWGVG